MNQDLAYNSLMSFKTALISALLLSVPAKASIWKQTLPYTDENEPPATSQHVYLYDIDHDQLLYSKHGEEPMYPASMTKVMSVLVAMETLPDPYSTVLITDEMWAGLIEENASVAGFSPGETPTVEELMYGAVLPSGADAVNALAIACDGSISAFVDHMNHKAAELGMADTHFTNPTGLHDPDHISSAKDMGILFREALNYPLFQEILLARDYVTGPLSAHPDGLPMFSTSWPLINDGEDTYTIPGYLGGKTGFTNPAGRCLVSHAAFNGMHLVLVTGGASGTGHISDAASVYSWFEENYEWKTLGNQGDLITSIAVEDSPDVSAIEVRLPETVSMDLPKNAHIETLHDLPESLHAPIEKGQHLGTVRIAADGQTIYEYEALSDVSASHSSLLHYWNAWLRFYHSHRILVLGAAGAVLLLVVVKVLRDRAKKKRRRKKHRRKSGS